jgi:hypothetical protein
VVWKDGRSAGANIYGARVNASGATIDSFVVSKHSDDQHAPAVACGTGGNALAAYVSWTDTLFGAVYGGFRVWARPAPFTPIGIAEDHLSPGGGRPPRITTVVRGVLLMGDRRQKTGDRTELFDASGRKVLDLMPGPNDVRSLAPGVYFVREPSAFSSHISTGVVRRVLIAK